MTFSFLFYLLTVVFLRQLAFAPIFAVAFSSFPRYNRTKEKTDRIQEVRIWNLRLRIWKFYAVSGKEGDPYETD